MSYKITEEGNVATVHLDGEIDMDVTEKAKEQIMPLIELPCLRKLSSKLEQLLYIEDIVFFFFTE